MDKKEEFFKELLSLCQKYNVTIFVKDDSGADPEAVFDFHDGDQFYIEEDQEVDFKNDVNIFNHKTHPEYDIVIDKK